jgi:hypothetical protein
VAEWFGRDWNERMIYDTIELALEAHKRGSFWFAPSTMRFFKSRVSRQVFGGKYFISSEDTSSPYYPDVRKYSVRAFRIEGDYFMIETIGEFQQYATRSAALSAIRKLLKAEGFGA